MMPFIAGIAIGLAGGVVLTTVFFRVTLAAAYLDQRQVAEVDSYYLMDEINRHNRK